jgi:tetratricopeptide (TPR) repeat protein
MRFPLLSVAGLLVVAPLAAQTNQPERLGRIDLPVSASGPARDHFVEGVLLLHSFMYDDAAEEFEAAQKAGPGFALAYWGEAMTKNHPLWLQRDAEAARKILARLGPTREARLAKAATKREQGYLDAVEELYADGDKADRDRAYAEAMRRLHEEFPADLEAQSFYALALLGSCEDHRDFAVYMKAAALAEEVFAKSPAHPGAVHYLIHAYDDPVHAPLGLRPARVYAKIAGAAAHALHMPSHIFFAMGMWDDVIASNEDSWRASDERMIRRHLGADERGWHGIYWREYALLQEGRRKEARALLKIAEDDARGGLPRVVSARDEMREVWAIETGCAGWPAPSEAPASNRDRFVRGYCSWKNGDAVGLRAALDSSNAGGAGKTSNDAPHAHGGPPASGYDDAKATAGGVMRMELEAIALVSGGDVEAGLTRAREAASAEDGISFDFGPPAIVKPAHELLGELLLAQKRPADARKEFQVALDHAPGRAGSLAGLIQAANDLHDDAAREAARIWRENHRRADDAGKASIGTLR